MSSLGNSSHVHAYLHLVRIANELRLAQREGHCNELRDQISLVENEINQIFKRIAPIDFARIKQVRVPS